MNKLYGISPLISTIILVGLALTIATFVVPWAFELVTSTANTTATEADIQIRCQNAAYDFDSSYGTYGISWNFTGTGGVDSLSVKIINTGTVNLYNFSVELFTNTSEIFEFGINSTYQKTPSNPLKPGRSAILHSLVNTDINGTISKLRVLNEFCQHIAIEQEF